MFAFVAKSIGKVPIAESFRLRVAAQPQNGTTLMLLAILQCRILTAAIDRIPKLMRAKLRVRTYDAVIKI